MLDLLPFPPHRLLQRIIIVPRLHHDRIKRDSTVPRVPVLDRILLALRLVFDEYED